MRSSSSSSNGSIFRITPVGEVQRLAEHPTSVRVGVFATEGAQLVPSVVRRYREQQGDIRLVERSCQPVFRQVCELADEPHATQCGPPGR